MAKTKTVFRIVEFEIEDPNGNKFYVEIGTKFITLFWGFIPVTTITWKKNIDDKNMVVGHKTIEKALEMIEGLKKLIPKYHRIA